MMKAIQTLLFSLFFNTSHCILGCDEKMPKYPCDENSEYCYPIGSSEPTLCVCKKGYEEYEKSGNNARKCKDIDECTATTKTCKPTFDCMNTEGGFRCFCPEGSMEIHGQCEKCDFKIPCGLNSSYCKDKQGPCACTKGFIPFKPQTGEALNCEDEDECEAISSPCGKNFDCINTVGSYKCQCKPGYTLNAQEICQDVDECAEQRPCNRNQICRNTDGSYSCETVTTAKPTEPQTTADIVTYTADPQAENSPDYHADQTSNGSLLGFGGATIGIVLAIYYAVM